MRGAAAVPRENRDGGTRRSRLRRRTPSVSGRHSRAGDRADHAEQAPGQRLASVCRGGSDAPASAASSGHAASPVSTAGTRPCSRSASATTKVVHDRRNVRQSDEA